MKDRRALIQTTRIFLAIWIAIFLLPSAQAAVAAVTAKEMMVGDYSITAVTDNWIAPPGVTSVQVEAWGGGGHGGGATGNNARGGGGAGGQYAVDTAISVTGGTSYAVTIASQKAAATTQQAGQDTQFVGCTTQNTHVCAKGGAGAVTNATANSASSAGASGSSASGIGDTVRAGGNGAAATGTISGGGGGGAGSTAVGGNASGQTAGTGTSVGGGTGGTGLAAGAAGNLATWAGGAGSGGFANNSTDRTGGQGGRGRMDFSYSIADAYPAIVEVVTGRDTADATQHTITMPASITAGDLLLVLFASDGTASTTSSIGAGSNWNELGDTRDATNAMQSAVYYKIAEGSDTLRVDTADTQQSAWITYQIRNGGVPTLTSATGNSTNANPPNHSASQGAIDYLWIAGMATDGSAVASTFATDSPANYSSLINAFHATTNTSTTGAYLAASRRYLSAASEDPGTFTNATEQWVAWTISVPSRRTILADGTDPGNSTIGPSDSVTDLDNFSLKTTLSTDTVTALTVTLGVASSYDNLSKVEITDGSNVDVCTDIDNPSSVTLNFTGCSISVTTTPTDYKVRITPKTHANMPAVPGASYGTTGTVTALTVTNTTAGTDTDSGTITVDNASPAGATSTSATSGDTKITVNWTTTTGETVDTVVLRWASTSAGSEVPVEGSSYTAGNTITTATVACAFTGQTTATALSKIDGTGGSSGCTTSALTNGQAYSYKAFMKDSEGNWDAGVSTSMTNIVPAVVTTNIQGVIYMANESTVATTGNSGPCDGSTAVISIRVNGGSAATGSCNGTTAAFNINTAASTSAGDTISVYLTSSMKANTVYVSDGNDDTGIDLYENSVAVGHKNAGPVTILDLDDYDNDQNATDMLYDAEDSSPDTIITENNIELHVRNAETFTPGGNVTTDASSSSSTKDGDLHIDGTGTLSMGTNALSVGGDYNNEGTFTKSSGQTTTFTATATGHTITDGGENFHHVTFNGSGGGWSFADSTIIDGALLVTLGTLSGTNNITVTTDVTGAGTINLTGGTFEQRVGSSEDFGQTSGSNNWTFSTLTFSRSAGTPTITTQTGGSGTITVSTILNVGKVGDGATTTLDAGDVTWILSATGTPLVFNVSSTMTVNTSTFQYTGATANIVATTYNNLTLGGTGTYTMPNSNITLRGNLVVTNGASTVKANNWMVGGYTTSFRCNVDATSCSDITANLVSFGGDVRSLASNPTHTLIGGNSTALNLCTSGGLSCSDVSASLTGFGVDNIRAVAWNGTYWVVGGSAKLYRCNALVSSCTSVYSNLVSFGNVLSATWNGTYWAIGGNGATLNRCNIDLTSCANVAGNLSGFGSNSIFVPKWNGTYWVIVGTVKTINRCNIDLTSCTDVSGNLSNFATDSISGLAWSGTYWFVGGGDSSTRLNRCNRDVTSCTDVSANVTNFADFVHSLEWNGTYLLLGGDTAHMNRCNSDATSCTDVVSNLSGFIGMEFNSIAAAPQHIIFAKGGGGSQSITDNNGTPIDLGSILVSANSGNTTLTLGSGIKVSEITVDASQTFAPGAFTTTILTSGAGQYRPFKNYGTFTSTSSTVTYNADGDVEIEAGSTTYNTLNFTPTLTTVSKIYTLTGTLTASGDWGITPDAGSALSLTVVPVGTMAVTGTMTISKANSATSSLSTTSSNYSVSAGALNIATGGTLTANASNVTLSGTGTPLTVSGTFTIGTSTVQYTGATATVTATTMNNLTLGSGGAATYTMPASSLTLRGNLLISSNANVTKGAGTVFFAKGGTQTWTDNAATKQDIGAVQVSVNGGATTLNLGSSATATSVVVDNSQTFSLNGANILTLTSTGTPIGIGAGSTFTISSGSTIDFTGSGATVPDMTYHHLGLKPSGASQQTLESGTFTVNGNLTIGDATNNGATAATNDPVINVTGTTTVASGATFTTGDGAVGLTGSLTVNGTISGSGTGTISAAGDVTGSGTINISGNTFEHRVGASQNFFTTSGANDWTFNNLTFGRSAGTPTITTQNGGSGGVIVSGTLNIGKAGDGAATTLNASDVTWTFSNSGTPIVFNASSLLTIGTSTFNFTATGGNTTIPAIATFYNLGVGTTSDGSTGRSFSLATNTVVSNTLTIGNGSSNSSDTFDTTGSNRSLTAATIIVTGKGIFSGNNSAVSVSTLLQIDTGGSFTAPGASGSLTISDDFSNSGTFTHSSGTVTVDDATKTSTITGTTIFNNFSSTTPAKIIKFGNGNDFTFGGALTLNPTSGYIDVSSDSSGNKWNVISTGTYTIKFVNLLDSGCGSGTNNIFVHDSVNNLGNNTSSCWKFSSRGGGDGASGGGSGGGSHVGGGGSSGGSGGSGGGSGGGGGTLPQTFTNSNGTALTTHDSSWTLQGGNFAINTNAVHSNSIAADTMAVWTAGSFNNNQYAEITLSAVGAANSIGVAVRTQSGAHSGYGAYTDSTNVKIIEWASGSQTTVHYTGSAFSANDVLRLEIDGTTLTLKQNGTVVTTVSDSTYSTGLPGLVGFGNLTLSRGDDWTAGSILGGGGGGGGSP